MGVTVGKMVPGGVQEGSLHVVALNGGNPLTRVADIAPLNAQIAATDLLAGIRASLTAQTGNGAAPESTSLAAKKGQIIT